MEDLWKAAFPAGTEFDERWTFSNLQAEFEEGGKLYGENVYLFGRTEPQFLASPNKREQKIYRIAVVIAVVPSNVGSVGSGHGIPIRDKGMKWVSYIPYENGDSLAKRLKSQIFILGAGPSAVLLHWDDTYEYSTPYELLEEAELEQDTVQINFRGVHCEFDWELDELDEFTVGMIETNALDKDQEDAFKEYVKVQVQEAKKKQQEASKARREAFEAKFQGMRFYKFYPVQTSDSPGLSIYKTPFIDHFYGEAHEVL